MSSFWLEYIQDGQQRQFSFDSSRITIGRDKTADFVLDHPTVSRHHAMIQAGQRGGFDLVVLSQGGLTAIDGGPVFGQVPLFDGSEIHFGQLSFTFRSQFAPPRPDPTANPATMGFAPSMPAPQQAAPQEASGGIDWNLPDDGGQQPYGMSAGRQQWNTPAPALAPTPQQAPQPAATDDGGIVSWDQIAASAEALNDQRDGRTDFERIQAAQAKAEQQSQKTSPALIIVAVVAVVGVGVWTLMPGTAAIGGGSDDEKASIEDAPFISWIDGDIDCVGTANCTAQALAAYKLGSQLADKATADIKNPYEAYKQFDRAERLLEVAGITTLPPEMADVPRRKQQLQDGLEAKFRQARANLHNHQTRKMYSEMANELNNLQAYFPDKRAKYYQWAVERERAMKDNGVYPVAPRF